jgi:PAS domain S-box-containing protein
MPSHRSRVPLVAVSRPRAWIVAVALVAAATAVRAVLDPVLGAVSPWALYLLAVLAAAAYGGLAPGLLAVGLATVAGLNLFVEPRQSFAFEAQHELASVLVFDGVALALVATAARMRGALDEREAERSAADRERARATAILESITDAFFAVDAAWRFTYVNPRAEAYYGRRREDMLGRSLWEVLPEKKGTGFEEAFREARDRAAAVHFEAQSPETRRWVEVHAYPADDGLAVYFRDVTEQRRARDELARLNAELRAKVRELETVIDIAPVAIAIARDPHCDVVTANRAFHELVGTRAGHNVALDGAIDDAPYRVRRDGRWLGADELPLQQAAASGQPDEFEVELVRADGAVRRIYGHAAALFAADGRVRGAIAAMLDLTEQQRAAEERERLLAASEQARAEAERASRAKDEFLAVLSHELRSPLQGVLGWVTLLRRGRLDEAQRQRALETIERVVRAQAELVNGILDQSKAARGRVEVQAVRVSLREVLHGTVEEMLPDARSRGLEVATTLDDCGPVVGDPERLHQVFRNILQNAIKFTPSGGRIDVRCLRHDGTAVTEVRDTGIGIAPAFLPRVFERFTQADATTTRRFGGVGLGLAIAQQLVELQGGRIEAQSEGEGRGATFRVHLPVAPDAAPGHCHDDEPRDADLRGLRVLVVEDDADVREPVALALGERGARVETAGSVREAIAACARRRPDVVVSDLSMPDEDGYALVAQLRRAPGTGRVRAIALTGLASPADRGNVLRAGFDAHVAKPVDPDALVRVIRSVACDEVA